MEPTLLASTWNCTLATPAGSVAFALTVMMPETFAPEAGDIMEIVGGTGVTDVLRPAQPLYRSVVHRVSLSRKTEEVPFNAFAHQVLSSIIIPSATFESQGL